MEQRKTTNFLLLILVIPVVFYLLKLLSFIFIPLISSMFIALLFLPLMRWLARKRIPKWINIALVILLILFCLKIGFELVQLSIKQILESDSGFFIKAKTKLYELLSSTEELIGISLYEEKEHWIQYFNKDNIVPTLDFLRKAVTTVLLTAFFVVLWLAESIDFQKMLNNLVLKRKHTSVKTFRKIEKDLIKFIEVKFFISLATGVFTGLCCVFFDVSFPIFWGLFAFVINFVQMVGSIITVIMLSFFAFVEITSSGTLLFFIICITGVQVLFGSILEPIFMGKSFSLNVITVLVMLMLWGFVWGVPGLIMAIPLTVFIKIILEQFPSTNKIAKLLSANTDFN